MTRHLPIATLLVAFLTGCSTPNPSFPLSERDAQQAIREMADDPKPLARPLVIVAGYGDPGFADAHLAKTAEPCLDDDRIARVSFSDAKTFDDCRRQLLDAVAEQVPAPEGVSPLDVEIDVVANSMGGLIARYAADPAAGEPHLRIARLFTISAPHLGSDMAELPISNQLVVDMRPGSAFLEQLNERYPAATYELIPYVRLGDVWVGEDNTAPPGEIPWWVPNRALQPAHLTAYSDPRIIADILRRLRDEVPYTSEPRTPLP